MRLPAEQFFLFLGATDTESATSRLRTDGARYLKKLLRSKPENWQEILQLLGAPTLQGVLATFTGNDYESMLRPGYEEVAPQILDAIAGVPHVVFVHEMVFFVDAERPLKERDPQEHKEDDGDHDPYGFMDPQEYFGEIAPEVRGRVNKMLFEREINVLPYSTNAERSVMVAAFLDDHERHLLFRIYVPSGRLYANEADTLLGLFREWLSQTGRNTIRQDGYRTPAGQVYEFFGTHVEEPGGLARQFQEFSDFLDACVDQPDSAAAQLEVAGVASGTARQLVSRYGKATRRLHLDLRQAREERVLSLKHEFESELLEGDEVGRDEVMALAERFIPPPGRAIAGILAPAVGSVEAKGGTTINVTVNQQLVGQLARNVVQNVQGTVNLGPEAKDLLELVREFGGSKALELESAVHELEDADARAPDRLAARQKLRRFLSTLGTQAATMSLSTLHKYLEQRLGVG